MQKEDFLALLHALHLEEDQIRQMAIDTGFLVRKKLVDPTDMLYAICVQATQGTVSCNDLATKIHAETAVCVSRQAISKKINKSGCLVFLQKILALVIVSKISKTNIQVLRNEGKFTRVLVQDSTIIGLPARLFAFFSGVSNAHSDVCNARVQCVYDLISETFISFSIDPYTKNDLKAAPELEIMTGDLVIRDRGYLTCAEIQRHREIKADCIYRHKSSMIYLDSQTGKPIDLLQELKVKKQMDASVFLNDTSATPVRLVAFPLSEQMANIRRMKAKKEMKKAPSQEYLELLSWVIFITTLPQETASSAFIANAYRLRWRIEIIFKSWKSNLEFAKIHNVSIIQLYTILLGRFIMIIICMQYIFCPAKTIIKKNFDKDLSILKVVRYLTKNPSTIIRIITQINNYSGKCHSYLKALAKYCSYEKRNRRNFQQDLDAILLS